MFLPVTRAFFKASLACEMDGPSENREWDGIRGECVLDPNSMQKILIIPTQKAPDATVLSSKSNHTSPATTTCTRCNGPGLTMQLAKCTSDSISWTWTQISL